jgi:hypothetical protein
MTLFRRKWTLISLLVLVPIGLATKFYTGPVQFWVNNSLGGVLYVVFWSILLYLFAPKLTILKNVVAVFSVTCALEVLQLWHPALLQNIRGSFFGATLLGTTFAWSDFFHYAIGAVLSLLLLAVLRSAER